MSAVLLVRLKIMDLTAWTAEDAARALLPAGHELTKIVREEIYLFEPADGASPEAFEGPLANAVDTSNFFVNPNKERYRLLGSGGRGAAMVPPEGAWGILARPRGDTRDGGLLERLQREHPLPGLGAIRRGRLWWLWTRPDTGAKECYSALGPVESTRRGLLVNPHAEASILLDDSVPWADVEAFLADPAEILESA